MGGVQQSTYPTVTQAVALLLKPEIADWHNRYHDFYTVKCGPHEDPAEKSEIRWRFAVESRHVRS